MGMFFHHTFVGTLGHTPLEHNGFVNGFVGVCRCRNIGDCNHLRNKVCVAVVLNKNILRVGRINPANAINGADGVHIALVKAIGGKQVNIHKVIVAKIRLLCGKHIRAGCLQAGKEASSQCDYRKNREKAAFCALDFSYYVLEQRRFQKRTLPSVTIRFAQPGWDFRLFQFP